MDQKVKELEAQVKQLAAENSALKDITAWCHTEAFSNMHREFKTSEALGCCNEDCMHDAMLTALMHAPETPNTDAFLSRLRNEERAEVAVVMDGHAERYDALARQTADFGVDNRYRYTAAMFRGVAKELREGKAGEVCSER